MDKEAAKELDFLQKVKTHLEDGKMAITMEMENEDEEAWMSTYNLLTWKPVIYAANVAEGDLADDGESNSHVQAVRKYAAEQNSEIFVICAEIEEEISELDDDEKKMFLEDLGLTESGLEKLVSKLSSPWTDEFPYFQVRMRQEHGRLKSEQRLRRQQVRSIQILSEDLLKLRL